MPPGPIQRTLTLKWDFGEPRFNPIGRIVEGNRIALVAGRSMKGDNAFLLDITGPVVAASKTKIHPSSLEAVVEGGRFLLLGMAEHAEPSEDPSKDRWDSYVELWSFDGAPIWRFDLHGQQLLHLRTAKRRIVLGTRRNYMIGDGEVLALDLSGKLQWRTKDDLESSGVVSFPYHLDVTPDGQTVGYAFMDRVCCIDAEGNELFRKTLTDIEPRRPGRLIDVDGMQVEFSVTVDAPVSGLALSADGRFMGIVGNESAMCLDRAGKVIWAFPTEDHPEVDSVFMSANGGFAILAGGRELLFLRDGKLVANQEIKDAWRPVVAFAESGEFVVVGSRDKRVYLFGMDGSLLSTFVTEGAVRHLEISPDERSLLALGDRAYLFELAEVSMEQKSLQVPRRVETGNLRGIWKLDRENEDGLWQPSGLEMSNDGSRVMLWTPRKLSLFDSIGQRLWTWNIDFPREIIRVARLSRSGRRVWVGVHRGLIWDPSSLVCLADDGVPTWTLPTDAAVVTIEEAEDENIQFETYHGPIEDSEIHQGGEPALRQGYRCVLGPDGRVLETQPLRYQNDREALGWWRSGLWARGRFLQRRAGSGSVLWSAELPAKVADCVCSENGRNVAAIAGVNTFLFDDRGTLLWRRRIGKGARDIAFLGSDRIVVTSDETGLNFIALDGNQVAAEPLQQGYANQLAGVTASYALVVHGDQYDRYLSLYDRNGRKVWERILEGNVHAGLAGDVLIFADGWGVQAFSLAKDT